MQRNQRLHILTQQEISAIYDRPLFNDAERRHYFSLSEPALNGVNLRSMNGKKTSAKLYFILQMGYFKAKHLFFNFQYGDVEEDSQFIIKTYLPNDVIQLELPSRVTQLNARNKILALFNFQDDSKITDELVANKLGTITQKTNNPWTIFNELKDFLQNNRAVLPPYSRLQDSIGLALKNEERRIIAIVKNHLTKDNEKSIQQLLEIDNVFYAITELKFDAKTFRTEEMQSELKKREMCEAVYLFSKQLLPQLALSQKNIHYYADIAKTCTVYRLKRLPKALAYFYLTCYVHVRYEKIINNLIQAFVYYIDKYNLAAKKQAENQVPSQDVQFNEYKKRTAELILWYADDNLMSGPGHFIQEQAYQLMTKEEILHVGQILRDENKQNDLETALIWACHKDNYRCILLNLRPLFQAIDFEVIEKLAPLTRAIAFLKNTFMQDKKLSDIALNEIPISHISPKKILSYFYENSSSKKQIINTYQYEFYIYNAIRTSLKKGQLFINNSLEYKSFDQDIKIPPNWEKDKEKILKGINNPVLLMSIDDILRLLENQLEPLITRVNQRAMSGENKHIKIKNQRDGSLSWSIPYPKRNEDVDNPFYNSVETITISTVYDFIEQRCGFMRAFKHIKPQYAKSKQDYLGIKATVLANGTTQGTFQFAKRSNLKYQRLQTSEQNHVRLETLREAAQIIVDYLMLLPLFEGYHLDGKPHGSVDGKKKKTKRRILKSRHSPKYFGLDIGVVIMTMNLNHLPFVTQIIGANEHEGHFTYSMLMENMTDIDPAIISTDTAGTNNVNDFLYYLIGKVHAACYRSTVDKADTISGFKSADAYEELLISPKRQVNEKLIKGKWPDLLPILASLLSHETTQHIIVSKLSSHEYKSDTKEALWELNHILKSIHILKYIDDPAYRQNIRTALNRGEAYHQLLNKITDIGSGDFRGMSELEVEIWSECTRLIALIIIAYNMCILSELYQIKTKQGDKAAVEFLKHISPIASQHLNIGGLYEFTEERGTINLHAVVDALNRILDETLKE